MQANIVVVDWEEQALKFNDAEFVDSRKYNIVDYATDMIRKLQEEHGIDVNTIECSRSVWNVFLGEYGDWLGESSNFVSGLRDVGRIQLANKEIKWSEIFQDNVIYLVRVNGNDITEEERVKLNDLFSPLLSSLAGWFAKKMG